MAVSAQTSQIPHTQHLPNPQFPKPHNLQTHQISFRKTQEMAICSTSAISTENPNSDLNELCCHGNLEKALKLLDSMQELQIKVGEDAYIALVRPFEWARTHEEGARVYSYVSNSTTLLSVKLGNALLSMFVRFGNLVDAWYVFGRMGKRDVFSWNVLVGGYAKAGFFDEALNLCHRMLWVEIVPDVYAFPCVLRTCGLKNIKYGETHSKA